MIINKYLVVIPGIILAFVLYTLSQGFNNIIGIELLGYDKSPISTAMIAILLGMIFGNIFKVRDSFQKGLDFTKEYILKFGIICLGIQLKLLGFPSELHGILWTLPPGRGWYSVKVSTLLHITPRYPENSMVPHY